ncbi:MAG TPA: Uma2 family endonuclease [Gemmataceae bacterium]|jgi:Uma2 family endonuclease|nr:Uma2 family endonuclease [Gemmataceae bacterium]
MVRAKTPFPADWTLADLLAHFGDISPSRIRLFPAPGVAAERDVTAIQDREDRLYELVDGVLVEKVMGYSESTLTCELIYFLKAFLREHDLGNLAGSDGTMRLMPGLVRIPDVSFVAWERLPGRRVPDAPLPDLVPDLAVEVLSEGNTAKEMARKLKDYFFAGVRLVWYVDPHRRTVQVYTAPDQLTQLREGQTLDGGAVLPGFTLPLGQLFATLPRPESGPGRRKKKS